MDDVSVEAKRQILEQMLQRYNQDYYAHTVNAKVAQDIGGMEQVVDQAKENMAKTQKLADRVKKLLVELEG